MEDFANYFNNLSGPILLSHVMLVLTGGYILHAIVESLPTTMVFICGFMLGSLFVDHMAAKYGVLLFSDADTNLLFLSTIGMIISLGVMLMLMRFFGALTGISSRQVGGSPSRGGN
ncbi:MAG: hypothetical protein KDJ36_15245 [Hyphomicrobiaceae bacterium]|nr:hypothetical protein [Hyphomicrobiaceae bacterium]